MTFWKFMTRLVEGGGNPREVKISTSIWPGLWAQGVHVAEVSSKGVKVSFQDGDTSFHLGKHHEIYQLEVNGLHRQFGADYFLTRRTLVKDYVTYTVVSLGRPVVVPKNSE
jgi:hypothetical protein